MKGDSVEVYLEGVRDIVRFNSGVSRGSQLSSPDTSLPKQNPQYPFPFNRMEDYYLRQEEKINALYYGTYGSIFSWVRETYNKVVQIPDKVRGKIQSWYYSLRSTIRGIASRVWRLIPRWVRRLFRNIKETIKRVYRDLRRFVSNPVRFLRGVINRIRRYVRGRIDWVRDKVRGLLRWLWRNIRRVRSRILETVRKVANWVWDITPEFIKAPLRRITELFVGIKNTAVAFFRDPVGTLSQGWDTLTTNVVTAFDGAVGSIVEPITGWLGTAWERLTGWIQGAYEWMVGKVKWTAEQIVSLTKGAIDWFGDTFSKIFTDLINRLRQVFKPASPSPEFKEAWEGLAGDYQSLVLNEIEKVSGSSIRIEQVWKALTAVALGSLGGASVGYALSVAAEAEHPFRQFGTRDVCAALLGYLGADAVIKPMITLPYNIGLKTPAKYFYQSKYHPLVPSISDATKFYWRGTLSLKEFKKVVSYQGFGTPYSTGYEELTKSVPPVQDIITMLVREVFVTERYEELVKEYPAEATEYFKLHGYVEEWAKRYWAMHWRLVPIGDLYDLYHRGIIKYETLDRFVKYHDIEAMCRPWIIDLAWDLPGRRSLRWMFEWGVARSYTEVTGRSVVEYPTIPKQTTDEKAFTEWLIARGINPKVAPYQARAELRNVLRAEIMGVLRAIGRMYRDGYLPKEDFMAFCTKWGIPETRAKLYFSRYEYERKHEELDALVKAWTKAYRKEKIDETKYRSALIDLGVQDWAINTKVKYAEAMRKVPA